MKDERLTAQIGDVADLVRGVTYKKQDASSEPAPGLVPLLRATNIHGELDFDGLVYVHESCVSEDQHLAPGDSVIAASSGSLSVVGKSATLRHEWVGTFGAFCYALRPNSAHVAPFYLSYFLQTSEYRSQVSRLAAGVNINNLKRQHLEELDIPLVSLTEQHRIVEAIESYFTRLDDAVANLERVQRNLKRYRASVLKSAVEGRLVPTEAELARAEGRDYEPASVLLERILAERRRRWEEAELAKMKAKGKPPKNDKWKAKYKDPIGPDMADLPSIPEGWAWVRLGDVAELLNGDRGKNYPSRAAYVEEGVPFITATNLEDGLLDKSTLNFIPEQRYDLLRAGKIEEGDILYCLRGSLGKSAIVRGLERGAIASSLVIVRLPDLLRPDYIHAALSSPWGQHLIELHDNGTAQPNLSAKSVGDYAIPLPPLAEAQRIEDELDRHASITVQLELSALSTRARCARLRQSILQWAFEGKLVDQDADDEPAAALLGRINAERGAAAAKKPKARRSRKTRSSKA